VWVGVGWCGLVWAGAVAWDLVSKGALCSASEAAQDPTATPPKPLATQKRSPLKVACSSRLGRVGESGNTVSPPCCTSLRYLRARVGGGGGNNQRPDHAVASDCAWCG